MGEKSIPALKVKGRSLRILYSTGSVTARIKETIGLYGFTCIHDTIALKIKIHIYKEHNVPIKEASPVIILLINIIIPP